MSEATRQGGTTGRSESGLAQASWLMYALAVLSALGALIVGVALMTHTIPDCTANPYNDVYGLDLQDCVKRHPFVGVGVGALAGGLVQAAVLALVARLASVVDGLRADRSA
jgi:hypothetical protein